MTTNPYFDPSMFNNMPMDTGNLPMNPTFVPRQKPPSPARRMPDFFLPALILFALSWIIHAIATFIPYWSVYSDIDDSRAGLWSARYFTYQSIQNFYVPEPTDFANVTSSIRFTTANTKGYLVTVQFLMTFNFVVMFLVLVLLIFDYVTSRRSTNGDGGFFHQTANSYDTGMRFALLLYAIYVFGAFEFAAWITYVASRHDNKWKMHASFGLTVAVSAFLLVIFALYTLEFFKRFKKRRNKWQYWYGPYIQWGFFVHLSALLLLLIVICCPEWAYAKRDSFYLFFEIGLFKQCYSSLIYKKSQSSSGYCTLSDTRGNQAWVNATQAFILMAFIFGVILFILMLIFRKEFRHDQQGYVADRLGQPTFTFIIAGLILGLCFVFSLIGVSIFGAFVFREGFTVNWAYILAIIGMVLFLAAGILFILDGVHSRRQTPAKNTSFARNLLFPAPLNQRVVSMQPLLKPEPARPPQAPMSSFPPVPDMSAANFYPSYPDQSMMMMAMPNNYFMEQQYPVAQTLMNNPSWPGGGGNLGLAAYPNNQDLMSTNANINELVRQHFLQQQRLNHNHERLLERYQHLSEPHAAEFRPFGSSSLPGRNYSQYLDMYQDDYGFNDSFIAMSRARAEREY